MIKKDNFKALLKDLEFEEKSDVFSKNFNKNSYAENQGNGAQRSDDF
jgi:hypothetical protein